MPTVQSIVYKPQNENSHAGAYLRRPLTEANLVADYGIEGDRKGGHPKRQLNVMDDITLAELESEDYPVTPGTLGENLVLNGIDLRKLPEGTHLRLGSEAVIALGKLREPCEQLTNVDERMPVSVVGRVGVMCRVIKSGRVKVGDPVAVIPQPVEA